MRRMRCLSEIDALSWGGPISGGPKLRLYCTVLCLVRWLRVCAGEDVL
jgi:hypothetical protein